MGKTGEAVNAYYNENDRYAAQWLRNLIAGGHIAPGDVDERSIVDVRADDLRGYTQCHFFAGIGGWSYALRLAGWADDRPVWTGSCPCQPFSAAGKQSGGADERHLWPVWFRLIRECGPERVFGEQVEGAVGHGWLDRVFADLEAENYACGAAVLGAHSVGAPHIRQRLYWVADAQSCNRRLSIQFRRSQQEGAEFERRRETRRLADADGGLAGDGHLQPGGQHGQQPQDGGAGGVGDAAGARFQGTRADHISEGSGAAARQSRLPSEGIHFWAQAGWLPCTDGKSRRIEPSIFPLAHGVPARMGKLRAAGNAIVPQTAAEFIRCVI